MFRIPLVRLALLVALLVPASRAAHAQFGPHPAFQPAHLVSREYNFGVAGGDATSLIFQWREGLSTNAQLTVDVGFADFDGGGAGGTAALFGGATISAPLHRATADLPLDLLFSGGGGLLVGDDFTQLRIPFGIVVGHRFALDRQLSLSPFVHPRLAITAGDGSDVDVEFDLGADLAITPRLSTRFAIRLGTFDALGISLAVRTPPLTRR